MPGRYAKDEVSSGFLGAIDTYVYRSPAAQIPADAPGDDDRCRTNRRHDRRGTDRRDEEVVEHANPPEARDHSRSDGTPLDVSASVVAAGCAVAPLMCSPRHRLRRGSRGLPDGTRPGGRDDAPVDAEASRRPPWWRSSRRRHVARGGCGAFTITQHVTVTDEVRADYEAAVRLLEEGQYEPGIALLLTVTEQAPA
jgi:hypothetical protein